MRMFWAVVVVVGVGCGGIDAVNEFEETCTGGACQAALCSPNSCEALGLSCGTAEDGCGGTIDCGPCTCEVSEDLGSALGLIRTGTEFRSSGVNFGLGYYHPVYEAFLWSAPHTGSFVISSGQGGVEARVRAGDCADGSMVPGPTAAFPERYELQKGQQVWITFVGDYGTRWATESNFYRLSITEAAASEAGLCGNGFNDDGDEVFDCADPDCSGDPACQAHACADFSPSPGIPLDLEMIAPPPALDRFPQPCGHPTARHVERVVNWTAPTDGEYVFHASGTNAYTISLWSQCGGEAVACSSNTSGDVTFTPTVVRRMAAGESVLVVLEGTVNGNAWAGAPSRLMVHERAAEGTVAGNCEDGLDNDADGLIDGC